MDCRGLPCPLAVIVMGVGGVDGEMKRVGNQNKRQKDAIAINWTVSLFFLKKPFESDREGEIEWGESQERGQIMKTLIFHSHCTRPRR